MFILKAHFQFDGSRKNFLFQAFFVATCFVAAASAAPQLGIHPGLGLIAEPAHYSYQYGVADDITGANFGQSEQRDELVTSGEYHVALPDGRIQTVNYHVDGPSGYIADVSYSGQPHYGPGLVSGHTGHALPAAMVHHGLGHHRGVHHGLAHHGAAFRHGTVHHSTAVNHGLAHHGSSVQHGLGHGSSAVHHGLAHHGAAVHHGLAHHGTAIQHGPGHVSAVHVSPLVHHGLNHHAPIHHLG